MSVKKYTMIVGYWHSVRLLPAVDRPESYSVCDGENKHLLHELGQAF
jgi:hypothetical protein